MCTGMTLQKAGDDSMSQFTNPASSTPAETAAYVAALLQLLGDKDPVTVLRETPVDLQRFVQAVPVDVVGTPEAPGSA